MTKKKFLAISSTFFLIGSLFLTVALVRERQTYQKKAAGESGLRVVCNYDTNYNCIIDGSQSVSSTTALVGAGNFDPRGMTFDTSGNFKSAVIFNDSLKGLIYNTSDLLTEANKTAGTIAMWVKPNFDLGFGTQTSDDHVLFQMYQSGTSRLNLIIRNGNKLEFMLNENDQGILAKHGIIAKISMAKKCQAAGSCCSSGGSCTLLPPGCTNIDDPIFDCMGEDHSTTLNALNWNKGEWHWVVASWGTEGAKLFIDGDMLGYDKNLKGGPFVFSAQTYIGIFRDGVNNNANSSIDDLKIWDHQVTDKEIQLMMKDYYYAREGSEQRRHVSNATPLVNSTKIVAGSTGNFDLGLVLNEPVLPGGGVRFLFKLTGFGGISKDNVDAMINDSLIPGTAGAGGLAYLKHCGSGTWVGAYCEIIANQQLETGTRINLRIGKGAGLFTFPAIARKLDIGIGVNTGNGFFFETQNPAYVNIIPDVKNNLAVFLTPSTVQASTAPTGQPVPYIIVKIEDKYLNTAAGFGNVTVTFTADPSIKIGNNTTPLNGYQYTITDAENGVHRFDNIIFNTPGKFKIGVSGGSLSASSNSFVVGSQPISEYDNYKLYWGDLHSHSTTSDGVGTVEENFDFARNKSALNFAAISDHGADPNSDHSNPGFIRNVLDPYNWSTTTSIVNRWNITNDFVAILGYEYGHGQQKGIIQCLNNNGWRVDIDCAPDYSVEGDWNVYYNGNGPLLAPQHVTDLIAQVGSWKQSNGANSAFILPHWGGRAASMSILGISAALKNDPSLVPGIEIISTHIATPNPINTGVPNAFEQWVRTGLGKWFTTDSQVRLGIMASSDNHSTMPGRPVDGSKMGIMAVWSTDLSRASIFEAISKRRFYAYSHGNRPIVEFFATDAIGNRHVMGEEISVGSVKPKFGFYVASSVGIKSIQIIKGTSAGTSILWPNPNVDYQSPLPLEVTKKNLADLIVDNSFSADSYYYLKVTTEHTGIAWTSPIWIKNDVSTTPTPPTTPISLTFSARLGGISRPGVTKAFNIRFVSGSVDRNYEFTASSAGNGVFSVPGLALAGLTPGSYTVYIRDISSGSYRGNHLRKNMGSITLTGGSNTAPLSWGTDPQYFLKPGDVVRNGAENNIVNITDIAAELSVYTALSVPVNDLNRVFDINGDNRISVEDISLALGTYTALSVSGD